MSKTRVIDSNILCRHSLQDHDDHSPRVNQLFLKIARGDETIYCPPTAIFEAIHIMHGLYKAPRTEVERYFDLILNYPGFETYQPVSMINALALWSQQSVLDFADCYHLALTKELGMTQIYSFDKKMGRYPGVERIEPETK